MDLNWTFPICLSVFLEIADFFSIKRFNLLFRNLRIDDFCLFDSLYIFRFVQNECTFFAKRYKFDKKKFGFFRITNIF